MTTPLYTIPVCVIRDLHGLHLDVHLAPKHQILNPELPFPPTPSSVGMIQMIYSLVCIFFCAKQQAETVADAMAELRREQRA